MAVHRLTTPSPPTSPRRSPRLGLPTRKRARVSDSDQQLAPSSSKLPLTPDPSPRWIRANKRRKVLDASPPPPPTTTTTPNANVSTRAGKRKSLTPNDHHELDSHHIVRKKRKENIVKDAPTANATTSLLKISVTQDTRQGGGNNNTGQSQSLKVTRNTRSMTRTMKKLTPDLQPQVGSSPPPDSTTRSSILTPGSILPLILASSSTIPPSVITQATDTKSANPTNDVTSTIGAITNDALPPSQDTATSIQPSTTSNSSSPDTTPLPLSKSPLEISTSLIMPLPISISSLPMSFMNVPLSMPLNLAFMNMPLTMPLSMPLNIPISTDISTTLPPSESELGFGFQPQEEFSSTGREEGQGKGNGEDEKGDREGEHVFPQQLSTPPLLTPARTSRSSPDIFLDCPPSSSPPPQSCTPCLNPSSSTPTRIPPRLAISTCLTEQSPPTSTSTTPPTPSSFINSTSPTHSSPLKLVCFPSLPVPQQQHGRRMKDWPMDMADDQRQTERALEQEMGMDLSLSFRNSSTGQEDELRLTQQELEEERSPLLDPAPQPSSSQSPDPYPQLAPPFPPSPACCSSSSSGAPSSSSRQYHKKVEYQQIPEWTPKLDKERNLWKLACKIRVWEITKRYTPDTIRTVVAQEAHDYYSAHGFPLGYGSVPVRSRKRRWRKIVGGAGSSTTTAAGSDSDCASSMMASTPSLSPPSLRDDEFMNEETYSFELMDDDDDMDGSVSSGAVGGLRSMEDEWRYEGFEDDDFEDDDDDDEDYDDLYEDDDDDDEVDEVIEADGDRTKITGNRKKKDDVSIITGEDQDQDPDAEGEMEIDIEPFQDPSFNAELSSPTSPTSPSTTSKSKSKSNSGVADEPQAFVSSFYIPTVPHVHHVMQMQQQQQQEEETPPPLADSSLDTSTNPLSSSSEGTPISTFDAVDHSASAPSNNENNHTPMQIHLPPAPHHPHHYHSQLIQFSSNILPLPPPRLDSVRVFILRQSEMGGLKTTGRGTPADRKRGAIWCGLQVGGGQEVGTTTSGSNKRGLDDGKESESESDEESGGEDDEGGKRGRPRLRLMLSDHDIENGPRNGRREGEGEDRATKRHKPSSSSSSSSTFVATDQTWDAFLASLDDKDQQPQQPPQQQGEVGTLASSVSAADSDTIITHGQLLLDGHLLPNQHRLHHHRERDSPPPPPSLTITSTTTSTPRLGPSLSPPTTSLEGSSGMFMFDHRGEEDDDDEDSTSRWFGDDEREGGGGGLGGRRSSGSSSGLVVVGSSTSSSGTCPSDALAMEGFNFSPVGPDGSSTLSYALG